MGQVEKDLVRRINAEHRACERAAGEAVRHAIAAGELLSRAKADLPHGSFLPWLVANFEGSERTAQIYMRLFHNREEVEGLQNRRGSAQLSINGALRELATLSAAPKEPEEDEVAKGGAVYDTDYDADHELCPVWSEEERLLLAEFRAGEPIVIDMHDDGHPNLEKWARREGLFERIDRRSPWGNPYIENEDGDRFEVVMNYAMHFLPFKPSLLARRAELRGKVLGCWCHPERCHGHVLKAWASGVDVDRLPEWLESALALRAGGGRG